MANEIDTPRKLHNALSKLIEMDNEEVPEARSFLERRNQLRQEVRLAVLEGSVECLPKKSNFYVGVKTSKEGRVSYKAAIYELVEKSDISSSELEKILKKHRGQPVTRLHYGKITDKKYDQKKTQLDLFISSS